jgi:imidazolonepropionase-like amidohydrolase
MSRTACCTALFVAVLVWAAEIHDASAQVAVRGEKVYTMAGAPIANGVVVLRDGKVAAVGSATDIRIPDGFRVLEAKVVTPGLVDARSTVGLSGILNATGDQDQIERSAAIQPELRAIDAYNAHDELVAYVRGFGVTTIHTGHAPGELISGQTFIAKTVGNSVEAAAVRDVVAVAATLDPLAEKMAGKSPGTRGKMMAMLRAVLIQAQEYRDKRAAAAKAEKSDEAAPPRDLQLEVLVDVLEGKLPLMLRADRAQDIASALRLKKEFGIRLWLDSAAESYLLVDEIKAADVPVLIHPTMARAVGDRENLSFETASKLTAAGIPVAIQSGFESYVPKTRVVLFEAARAAAEGLTFEQALATVTIDAARILGVADRVGSIEVGKDGDLALYDGDPFEYTTHCTSVVIEGQVVSDQPH